MRKLFVLFLVCCCNFCYAQKHTKFDYDRSKNPWVDAFKDWVFFSSLKIAYQSDTTIFKLIEKKDALNPYDGLSLKALNKSKLLGRRLIENMPPKPAMCEDCTPGMNYYMAAALHYYASRELDLIAKSEYKKHVKEDNYHFSQTTINGKKKRRKAK